MKSTKVLQPREQPVQTLGAAERNQLAGAEAEVAVEQRAHRADVDGVPRVVAVQLLAREGVDELGAAAAEDAELRLLRHLVHEAHAAGAEDAALLVE